ncbi:hypothetical protein MRX96_010555 [Rhipicephalus microplus]
MHSEPGYLYTARVEATVAGNIDVYYQKVGVRTVRVTNDSLLINDRPFYLMGFGKHEDSNIRGKGLDMALVVKDFNLINWLGANSFRTSHYPYAEEIMDQADAQGIAVIDEAPAVSLSYVTFFLRPSIGGIESKSLQPHIIYALQSWPIMTFLNLA